MPKRIRTKPAETSGEDLQDMLAKAMASPGVAEVLEVYRRTAEVMEKFNSLTPGKRYTASVSNATG